MGNTVSSSWQAADVAVGLLQQYGFEGYLVGGAVRDILLGNDPKDFDVVTSATPEQIARISEFAKASYTDTAQAYGVTRVSVGLAGGERRDIEIATYRRDIEAHLGRKLTKVEFSDIEDDLQRRDFTINALALDPYNDFLVDLHGGLADLDAKLVRFIGDPAQRITEDPLRIIRAIRFRNQLGFEYEPETRNALVQAVNTGALADIAVDRVGQELTRLLVHPTRRAAVKDLDELGALEVLLPEVSACKGVQQPRDEHSEGDVWEHTLLAIDALPRNPSVRLAWATLLHDVGKPPTFSEPQSPNDRIHFNNHFRVGGEMAKKIMARFNASKKLQADVSWLVHYHLITDSFPTMKQSRRYHYMSHPAFHDLLELHAADLRGSVAADSSNDNDSEQIAELEKSFEEYRKLSQQETPSLKKALGVDGHWLKEQFGLTDGATIGTVLKQLQDDFLDGDIKTIKDAKKRATELTSIEEQS